MRNDYENFNNNWTFFLTLPLASLAGVGDGSGEPTQTELIQYCDKQSIVIQGAGDGSGMSSETEGAGDGSGQPVNYQAYLACIQEVMAKAE